MVLSQKKIYLVSALTIAALAGIVIIQCYWVNSSFENEQKQFDNRIKELSIQLGQAIVNDSSFQKSVISFLNNTPSKPNALPLKKKLEHKVDSLFNSKFNDLSYEFGLVSIDSTHNLKGEVLFSSTESYKQSILKSNYNTCACIFDGTGQINFYFPNRDYYIASQLIGLLLLSFLLILIVVGCLTYTILTIRRQKKLSEMKNDFINNMTHEFKTPIFSISLASKTLRNSEEIQKSQKLKKYLNLISDENDRLKSQVDKVLQMALLGSQDADLEKEQVDLHKLIKKAASNFDLQLSERGGAINLHLNAEKHIVYADKTHVSNIINNLLDNAMKYTKEEPEITISTTDKNGGISFSINDNGIGMDAETKKHLFDKFYRAQTGNIHEQKGFGLGLSYVKNIVEAHEGWIKLKSKLNKGSTFTIFLPA
ncbi:MAG: HAMP domain-containing sensor histidine kinase [Balneolaceae bacterium]|nr:HAMP domain-containing sensor histidine kinase [Balneolaceae bacterium]